jgi:hypothetical protein
VRTDTDESRRPRTATIADRPGLSRLEPPLTGDRCMPGRMDSPHGTAGISAVARFAPAKGAFQVLIRIQYLRTLVQGWRRSAGAHSAARVHEIELGVRGLSAAARSAGLSVYEQACECLAADLAALDRQSGVSAQLLCQLLEWLSASARHLRRPGTSPTS